MNGNGKGLYQFQINLFNRLVTVSMNHDYAGVIADLLEYNENTSQKWSEFIDSLDKCMNGEEKYISGKEFAISEFAEMYQLNCTSTFAKELADTIGCLLSWMRNENHDVSEYPIDVIFAFVKKLELAGFNYYRDLQERPMVINKQPIRSIKPVHAPRRRLGY